MISDQNWAITSVRLFISFSESLKYWLHIEYHIHIAQRPTHLTWNDTCQIWIEFQQSRRYFCMTNLSIRRNWVSVTPTSECGFVVSNWGLFHPCIYNGPLARYTNCGLCMHQDCRESFPRQWLQRQPLVSDPGMHRGASVTHVPWCMLASLTRGGGENVSGIPGTCTTHKFTHMARGPCFNITCLSSCSKLDV